MAQVKWWLVLIFDKERRWHEDQTIVMMSQQKQLHQREDRDLFDAEVVIEFQAEKALVAVL